MELIKHVKNLVSEQIREAIQDGQIKDGNSFTQYLCRIQGDPISYINGLIYTKDIRNWFTSYPLDFIDIYLQHFNPTGTTKTLDNLVINVISLVVNCVNFLDYNEFINNVEEDEDDGNY